MSRERSGFEKYESSGKKNQGLSRLVSPEISGKPGPVTGEIKPPEYKAGMELADRISQLHEFWDKNRAVARAQFVSERAQEAKHIKDEIRTRLQMIVARFFTLATQSS